MRRMHSVSHSTACFSRSKLAGLCWFLDSLSTTLLVGVGVLLLAPIVPRRPAGVGVVWGLSSASSSSNRRPSSSSSSSKAALSSLSLSTSRSGANTIRVAVIGGGVAGLACADALTSHTNNNNNNNSCWDVTVFDTGRLRPGGRCSSRQVGDKPSDKQQQQDYPILNQYRYDHAAQILALPCSPNAGEAAAIDNNYLAFAQQVTQWENDGIVTPFPPNSIYNVMSPQNMQVLNGSGNRHSTNNTTKYYYGTRGMGSIPQAMVQQSGGRFKLQQDVWISPSNGVQYHPQSQNWRVQVAPKVWQTFDRLVIAHNGKCADRLMSATPARDLHALLRVNFAPTVSNNRRMTLNSLYSLTFVGRKSDKNVLSQHLPETFVAGYIQNHPALRFLTCQTRKYPTNINNNDDESTEDTEMEVWTVLSSPSFAQRHKAPQEFLPPETIANVTRELLQAVHEVVVTDGDNNNEHKSKDGLSLGGWEILDSRLQLWGAAVPLNVWHSTAEDVDTDGLEKNAPAATTPAGFLYDAAFGVGACGDWLVEPSLAGAWISGQRLAQHVRLSSSKSHGLSSAGSRFIKSDAAASVGIGALPNNGTATSMTHGPGGRNNSVSKNKPNRRRPAQRRNVVTTAA